MKLTSLRDTLEDFGISNFEPLIHAEIEQYEVSGLMLGYDQNVLLDSIFIILQNEVLYYCQLFDCPTSIERL